MATIQTAPETSETRGESVGQRAQTMGPTGTQERAQTQGPAQDPEMKTEGQRI